MKRRALLSKAVERLRKAFQFLMRGVTFLASVWLPVNRQLAFFESFLGNSYAGNPKYIYETMLAEGFDLKYVWVFGRHVNLKKMKAEMPGEPILVTKLTLRYYLYFVRAGILVNNSRFPKSLNKNRRSTYIQTWHGTPLKRLVLDQENVVMRHGRTREQYFEDFLKCRKRWDYLMVQNAFSAKVLQRAFDFKGKILESGYPRNQVLFLPDAQKMKKIESVKEKIGVPPDKKIVLYAPTFRDNKFADKEYYIDISLDFQRLHDALNGEYIILTRFHYLVSQGITDAPDFVIDVSEYADISELFLISEMLITDYSSVFFDYANTGRPIYFYMDDIDEYDKEIRGFYLDIYNELPGPICETNDALISQITKPRFPQEKYRAFVDRFTYRDGENCCKEVIDIIKKQIDGN